MPDVGAECVQIGRQARVCKLGRTNSRVALGSQATGQLQTLGSTAATGAASELRGGTRAIGDVASGKGGPTLYHVIRQPPTR